MSWIELIPALGVASVLVVVPGAVLLWILRLRGLWIWALAGPASISTIAVASFITPLLGLRWSLLAVCLATAALAAIALLLRILFVRESVPAQTTTANHRWLIVAGLVAGGLLVAVQLGRVIGDPMNISQTFDNVFHLNAIRFVLDTGNASPLHVGRLTGDSLAFYPSGWHGLVALVAGATGAPIPAASNAVVLVIAVVVWPAGIVLLTRVLSGRNTAVVAAAGVLAASLPAFPLLLADYGVLYPYLLGVALLPALIAAVFSMLSLGRQHAPLVPLLFAVLGSLPGISIAHPGALMALLAMSLTALVFWTVQRLRRHPVPRRPVLHIVVLAGAIGVFAVAWYALRPDAAARGWPQAGTIAQAAGEVILLSPHYTALPVVTAVAFIVALLASLFRRTSQDLLAIVSIGVIAALYVVAKAFPIDTIRDIISGPWYNDANRLAALLPIFAVPIAARGIVLMADGVRRLWVSRGPAWKWSLVAVVLVGGSVHAVTVTKTIDRAAVDYQYAADAPLLSKDERTLLQRLPQHVPREAVIAGSPWTGTSLAYAFTGREVLMPHMLMDLSDDDALINAGLADAQQGDAVCDAVERTGVRYVLDFGVREVHGAAHDYPGYEDLMRSDTVKLVDHVGDARLYEVIGCEEIP